MTTSLDSGASSGTAVRGLHLIGPALERTGVDEVAVTLTPVLHALEKRFKAFALRKLENKRYEDSAM